MLKRIIRDNLSLLNDICICYIGKNDYNLRTIRTIWYNAEQDTMAARKMRGCREAREISVETYANVTEGTTPLLSSQGTSKSHSRANSEETSFANSNHVTSSGSGEITGAAACTPDQINFISGNSFVEITKGILHLFKEE